MKPVTSPEMPSSKGPASRMPRPAPSNAENSPSSTLARTRRVRSMTFASTRISASCATITQIRTVARVPASYFAPTQRSRNGGSQTMIVAPAPTETSQESTIVSLRTRAARSSSRAPTRPPSPGIVAEITMNTRSVTDCGTKLVSE